MDFENELYKPLRESSMNVEHQLIFPHENGRYENTKGLIHACDLVVAEVSQASTGVGIELGWANMFDKDIICINKVGTKPSNALKFLTKHFAEYETSTNLPEKLEEAMAQLYISDVRHAII